MADKTLGQIAFEAHRDFLDGNRPWSDVRPPEREVWEATAKAVAEPLAAPSSLPAREDFRTALTNLVREYFLDVQAGADAEEVARVMDEARMAFDEQQRGESGGA